MRIKLLAVVTLDNKVAQCPMTKKPLLSELHDKAKLKQLLKYIGMEHPEYRRFRMIKLVQSWF